MNESTDYTIINAPGSIVMLELRVTVGGEIGTLLGRSPDRGFLEDVRALLRRRYVSFEKARNIITKGRIPGWARKKLTQMG